MAREYFAYGEINKTPTIIFRGCCWVCDGGRGRQQNEFSFCHNCDIELMFKCGILLSQWKTIFQLRATIFDFRVVVSCQFFFFVVAVRFRCVACSNELQNLQKKKSSKLIPT